MQLPEQRPEDRVRVRDQPLVTAEAQVQADLLPTLIPDVAAHPPEQRHVGPAEAVDRLLLVAHHRPGRAGRQLVEQFQLHRVGVLRLVDQEGLPARVVMRPNPLVLECAQGMNFQVAEVDHPARVFRRASSPE